MTQSDYRRLLDFRDGLRRFLRWSEDQANSAGLTPAQHQLLLTVAGHPGAPTVGDVARHLQLRHHSAVGLVDRAEAAGLVARRSDRHDQRVVHLVLTDLGRRRLERLASQHLEELRRLSPRMRRLWTDLASDPAIQ